MSFFAVLRETVEIFYEFTPYGKEQQRLKDIWVNCGVCVKVKNRDPLTPTIMKRRKTEYGYDLLLHLPPGLSHEQFKTNKSKLEWAFSAKIEFEQVNGKLLLRVVEKKLPQIIPYSLPENWERLTKKMYLPVPIGYNLQNKLVILDLNDSPHMLVGGLTKYGKSNFLHQLIHTLKDRAEIYVVDLKGLDFHYLSKSVRLAQNEREALSLIKTLEGEFSLRRRLLQKAGVIKIEDYSKDLPFIILIIDELAEIQNERFFSSLNRLVRLARAVGISIVAATQRPSVKVIDGDTRAMFYARLCFQAADELNSRMILGEAHSEAAHLPGIKGRAIYRFQTCQEVQVMYFKVPTSPVEEEEKIMMLPC